MQEGREVDGEKFWRSLQRRSPHGNVAESGATSPAMQTATGSWKRRAELSSRASRERMALPTP